MLSTTSQLQFAAEFIGVLVAASGLSLVSLRPHVARGPSRLVLAGAFATLGTVAFLRGSQLAGPGQAGTLGIARVAGGVLLLAGTPGWMGGRRGRAGLALAAALTLTGGALEAGSAPAVPTDVVLAAGHVVLAAAILAAARRSIAARVAAAAATTLLLVVLVLSVALSAVITDAVEQDRLLALGTLARVDAGQVAGLRDAALASAQTLTAALDQDLARSGGRRRVGRELGALAGGYPGQEIGYLPAGGGLVAPADSRAALTAVARLPTVTGARCLRGGPVGRGVVGRVGGAVAGVGAEAVCAAGAPTIFGTVVVVDPVTAASLASLEGAGGTGVALVASGRVVASTGAPPPSAAVRGAAAGQRPRREGSWFVAVAGIAGTGVVVLTSSTTAGVASTQASLDRTLFVIALGGTVLALVLAVLTGDRITAGLRRLTTVARRIEEGSVSERSRVVSDDEVGTLAGAFDAMVSSIEEQSFALREAADAEARLRGRLEAVVAGMGDALVALDPGRRVTDFNRAAEQLTGVPAAEALGSPAGEVVHVEGGLDAVLRSSDAGAGAVRATLTAPAGTGIPVAVSVGVLDRGSGQAGGTVLVIRDLRREEEVERMKTEFLSRVGHELRTPLTGILGYADILLRRDVAAAQARQWHAEIVASAKRQLRIIQLLEFFAAAGAGRVPIREEVVDPGELARTVVSTWSERLGEVHPTSIRVAAGVPAVNGDPRWLALALDEVVDNAAKFSPAGGRILVTVASADGSVEIRVRDHGPGMTAQQRESAFAEFVQGDSSDTRRFGGLGLGLALVQRVAAAHGGSAAAHPARGKGTVVVLRLPARDPAG